VQLFTTKSTSISELETDAFLLPQAKKLQELQNKLDAKQKKLKLIIPMCTKVSRFQLALL